MDGWVSGDRLKVGPCRKDRTSTSKGTMIADWLNNHIRLKFKIKSKFACEVERPSSLDGVFAPRAATDG